MAGWPPLPKEHGAWAQLTLAAGAASLAVPAHPGGFWAWVAALMCAFLAHEPLLILLGQRSAKASKPVAWMWLGVWMALGGALGLMGWRAAPEAARMALLAPMAFGALLLPGIARGEEKSLPGEGLAALALGSAALPLALRGGLARGKAVFLALGLMLAFTLGTMLVRRFLAELRKRPEPLSGQGAAVLTGAGAGLGIMLLLRGQVLFGLACLPLPLLGFRLFARPWPPSRMKRLGWALAFGNFATAVLLALALR
ncbi:MAG: YwiC-like family protein [Acidobacteria bacterium]|nr:YwiC-like family protein [Acidobacteriota bacterium]